MGGTNRRTFLRCGLALTGIGLLSGCDRVLPRTQPPAALPTIGWLSGTSAQATAVIGEAFRQGLEERGYVEGRSVRIERRFGEGRDERLPDLAAELVRLGPRVIVTNGTPSALAAKRATGSIPILAVSGDPVGAGLVASLPRPGGNVTGFTVSVAGLWGKRLELLKATVPAVSRLANLGDAGNPASAIGLQEVREAAGHLGLQLHAPEVRGPDDLEGAFEAAVRARADALVVQDDSLTSNNRARVVDLAARHRLPAIYSRREFVEPGGLMAYGVSFADLWRRMATQVDKVLRGAEPADLPVEQPTKFDFVINLNTAQGLGLAIPPSVLQQATEVIQ
jgi:putative ABC transport system substrate-binding protein